jgi:hypothetical protein
MIFKAFTKNVVSEIVLHDRVVSLSCSGEDHLGVVDDDLLD